MAVSVGVGVNVAVAVKVLVTVNVGVKVNIGGRRFAASPSVGAFSASTAGAGSFGSTTGVSTCASSVQATKAAIAPLTITTVAKSEARRDKLLLLRRNIILKG